MKDDRDLFGDEEDDPYDLTILFHFCNGTGFCSQVITERRFRLFRGFPKYSEDGTDDSQNLHVL